MPRPCLVRVYGPLFVLGPRSLHKERDGVLWGLRTHGVTFLEGWSGRRGVEVWDETNGAVWSGLVSTSEMKHVDCLRIECGHNLQNKQSQLKVLVQQRRKRRFCPPPPSPPKKGSNLPILSTLIFVFFPCRLNHSFPVVLFSYYLPPNQSSLCHSNKMLTL